MYDSELVAHLFASLTGPDAAAAVRALREIWQRCRDVGAMREPVPALGVPGHFPDLPATRPGPAGNRDLVLAAQQAPTGVRQAVLRRQHDLLSLSVVLAPTSGATPADPQGWKLLDQHWEQLAGEETAPLVGAVRIYQAVAPSPATAADQRFAAGLRAELPATGVALGWPAGALTPSGLGMWEVGADDDRQRRLLILAPPGGEPDLSAWSWSRGDAHLPPLARWLLHAALIRYHERVHTAGYHELEAIDLAAESDRMEALTDGEARAETLAWQLGAMRRSVAATRSNLSLVLGEEATSLLSGPGPLAADLRLADGLLSQLDHDLARVADSAAHLRRSQGIRRRAERAAAELQRSAVTRVEQGSSAVPDPRTVFVVHGRDLAFVGAFTQFLRALDLRPRDWEEAVDGTRVATPFLGDAVRAAFGEIQAAVVLLTPDDVTHLHADLREPADPDYEARPTCQARPNVLFEAGMALALYPERTILVEVGSLRPFSDLGGRNVVRFDGSVTALKKVAQRLKIADCAVNDSGTDWLDINRFAGLATFTRRPGTGGS